MKPLRSAKIHPIVILLLFAGVVAGCYVQYSASQARKAEERAEAERKANPNRGLRSAAEMLKVNPRPERARPFKFVFSDTAPTRSETGKSSVEVKYSAGISTAEKYGTRHKEIMLDGVKHFRETNSFNKKAIVSDTADILEEIVESLHVGMGSKLIQFRERLSPILLDPQVSGDPFFQYLAGLVHIETGEDQKAEELLFGAIIDHTKYDYPSRYVLPAYNVALENGLKRNIHSKLHERAADAIVCWLKYDFSESNDDHRYVWEQLSRTIELLGDDGKLEYIKKISDLNRESPFAPQWIMAMMEGKYHFLLAEQDAESEDENAAQGIAENLKQAGAHFAKALELNPGFPEAITEMISVSKLSGDTEKSPSHWASLADEKGFDDYRLHQRMLATFETAEDQMAYGVKSFETGKFDSAIPFALVGAYQRAQDSIDANENKESVKQVIECLSKLAENPTPKYVGAKQLSQKWLLSAQAAIAARAGQNESAAKAFEALGSGFDKNVLKSFPGIDSVSKTRVRVSAAASGSMERVDRIEALLEKQRNGENQTEAIEKEVAEALKTVKGDKVYFESVGAFNKASASYEEGKSTKLKFRSGMLLWESETENQIESNDENSIVVSTLGGNNHATLNSTYYTPGPKTIDLDVEFVSTNDPCAAEIVFGGWRDYGSTGVLTLNGPGKFVGLGSTKFDGNIAKFKFNATAETNTVRLNVADGYLECFVNNQFVFRSSSSRIKTTSQIGLGLNGYGKMRGKVKFSNLRVRKWEKIPSLEDGDLAAYYKAETKNFPDNGYGWLFRGIAELKNGQFEVAKTYIGKAVDLGVPEFQAAPYLGEIADRKGDAKSARMNYKIVFDGMEKRPAEILQTGDKDQTYDQFQVAAGRFIWNELTRDDLEIESRAELVKTYDDLADGNSPLGSNVNWVNQRLEAQARSTIAISEAEKAVVATALSDEANKILEALEIKEGFDKKDQKKSKTKGKAKSGGKRNSGKGKDDADKDKKKKSDSLLTAESNARQARNKQRAAERKAVSEKRLAIKAIDAAIEGADEKFHEELNELKASIEAGTAYSRKIDKTANETPSYLGNDDLKLFPILKDYLRAEWKSFYE